MLLIINSNVNCYENSALIPSTFSSAELTFRPKPNLAETTEIAYLSYRPLLIVDVVGSNFMSIEPLMALIRQCQYFLVPSTLKEILLFLEL